jgi:hypothetical protein
MAKAWTAASVDVASSLEASFLHLSPRPFWIAGENLPLRACDVGAFGVVSFLEASRGFPTPLCCPVPAAGSWSCFWWLCYGSSVPLFFLSLFKLFPCFSCFSASCSSCRG